MPQDPPASSGGSPPLREEGSPVSVAIGNNESVSPPTGKIWIGYVGATGARVKLNGGTFLEPGSTMRVVVTDSDSVGAGANSDGKAAFSGWEIDQ